MADPKAPRSPDESPPLSRGPVLGRGRRRRPRSRSGLIAACSRPRRPRRRTAAAPLGGGVATGGSPAAAAAAGTVSIGSYHTDPGEPEGMEAVNAAFTRHRHRREDEHRRPQHVPEPDHELPRRHAGDRVHLVLGLPHEVLRGQGPRRSRSTTCGPRSRTTTPRASRSRSSATTARSTRSRPTTTRGRSSTGRASSRKGLPDPRDLGRPQDPGHEDAGRRPDPDRVRRPGRLAGDGHVDILNLRLNGYDFHVGLMAGKQKWTDPKVTAVFQKWTEILPFHAKDYAGLKWTDAATR